MKLDFTKWIGINPEICKRVTQKEPLMLRTMEMVLDMAKAAFNTKSKDIPNLAQHVSIDSIFLATFQDLVVVGALDPFTGQIVYIGYIEYDLGQYTAGIKDGAMIKNPGMKFTW